MTTDVISTMRQRVTLWSKHDYSVSHKDLLLITLGALSASLWLRLAFFSMAGRTLGYVILIALTTGLICCALLASGLAVRWTSDITKVFTLRRETAMCSLTGCSMLLFVPEYLVRVHPPQLRSLLLLVLFALLWSGLYTLCLSSANGVRLSDLRVRSTALAGLGLLFAITTTLAIRKYLVFGYVGQDLAYFGQIMYTTLHGSLFRGNLLQDLLYSKPVTTDFAGHNSPVMFLFLPFYAIAPNPITLLVLRNVALFACAFPIYRLARLRVPVGAACLWAAAWLLTPAVLLQSTFDFYPLTFAVLPLLYTILFCAEHRFNLFTLALACTLLVREDLVFFAFGMGALALWQRRPLRWTSLPILASLVWGVVSFKIVLPAALHGATFVTDACFSHLGATPAGMLNNILLHPQASLFPHGNLVYLLTLLSSSGLILSCGSLVSWIALPYVFINLMAGGGPCITTVIAAQYSVVPATLIFAGTYLTATAHGKHARLALLGRLGLPHPAAAPMILITFALATLLFNVGQTEADELRTHKWSAEVYHILTLVPDKAGVAAPRYMLPHIANRDCLYQTHRLGQYHYPVYQYLIIDKDWSHIDASPVYEESYQALVSSAAQDVTLQPIYSSAQYVVYLDTKTVGQTCIQPNTVPGKSAAAVPHE